LANTFQLEIITPTQIFTEGQVSYVRAESPDGQFGIMAKHTSATVALGIGEVKVVKDGKELFYATTGGFADIQPESVLLLLETVELVSNIDIERAKKSMKRAQDRLKDKNMNKVRSRTAIAKAKNRLRVSTK
jgi:F-type H+-transporting ATPase subunit epsilon